MSAQLPADQLVAELRNYSKPNDRAGFPRGWPLLTQAADEIERLQAEVRIWLELSQPPPAVHGLRSMGFMPYGTHVDLIVSFDSMENAKAARESFTKIVTAQPPSDAQ